ncbi:MAG TPA: orotate phosphoribosyltransferase [bacterium]|nr:orotate phosphoribosyltransferase [bacterium]
MRSDEVLEILEASGAVRRGHFRLTSGLHSDLFLLCAQVIQYPKHTERLAEAMAGPFSDQRVQVVVGPALGGIILAYEVARVLGARAIFAEKTGAKKGEAETGASAMALRRGFSLRPGERALVVEDALTTGGSIRNVIEVVRAHGAQVVGAAVLVDRSGGKIEHGVPLHALLSLEVQAWEPAQCPLCREHVPLIEPKEA